jgi:hypothetical protein
MHACMRVYVCMYVCMYVPMYVCRETDGAHKLLDLWRDRLPETWSAPSSEWITSDELNGLVTAAKKKDTDVYEWQTGCVRDAQKLLVTRISYVRRSV